MMTVFSIHVRCEMECILTTCFKRFLLTLTPRYLHVYNTWDFHLKSLSNIKFVPNSEL
jgi:hypothetical protein